MAIKRYTANADNTIVNAFKADLETRGTGANAGAADVVEVFSIYDRVTTGSQTGSQELSRILINFPISNIITDRSNGNIPASGSVSFYLKMYNARTSKTVPKDYKLIVQPISQSWEEGDGLDLENYKDITRDGMGSNWDNAASGTAWTNIGGDYLSASSDPIFSQSFSNGLEDLEIDISDLVEKWIAGSIGKYGVGIRLSSSYEAYYSNSAGDTNTGSIINNLEGAKKSYYTKRFFARKSQYFFKRPVLEARWDSAKRDDRGDFYYSSSLAPAADNLNTLYLYNYVRGRLRDIPDVGTGAIFVSLYSGSADNSEPSGSKLLLYDSKYNITGGHAGTGIYTASVAITAAATPIETLYDVWHSGTAGGSDSEYFTGSITPSQLKGFDNRREPVYYINITNLKSAYRNNENARFNLYVRDKYWSPTIYTVASNDPPNTAIVSASYRVFRLVDAYEAIPYGTGSKFHTGLSYDVSGNYFDLNMELLEPGYAYALKFAFYDPELDSWVEQPEKFKFRVESYEY